MGLIDFDAQCRALLLCRMYVQSKREGTASVAWMKAWGLTNKQTNPPHVTRQIIMFVYLYTYAVEMAYITPPEQHESLRAFRNCTSNILHTMALANKGIPDMRITQIHPDTSWNRVWHNLHAVWTFEEIKAVWYMAIQDVIPTNDRLEKIRLRASKSLHSKWTKGHSPAPPDGVYRDCQRMVVDTLPNCHHHAKRSKKISGRNGPSVRASSSGLHSATGPSYGYSPT